MGVFDFFKKKENDSKPNIDNTQTTNDVKVLDYRSCIEIAKIISNNDEHVMKEVNECVNRTNEYFDNHKSEYENRGIYSNDDIDSIIWIGLVSCLIENNFACERDWNDELEDFVFFMNEMKYDITINKEILNEDESVTDWCAKLDEAFEAQNICIGGIDIDSDSYVLFVCKTDKLDQLKSLASSINHKIALAKHL